VPSGIQRARSPWTNSTWRGIQFGVARLGLGEQVPRPVAIPGFGPVEKHRLEEAAGLGGLEPMRQRVGPMQRRHEVRVGLDPPPGRGRGDPGVAM